MNPDRPLMKRILLPAALCLALGGCWTTGEGEKVGIIVKQTRQGLICKTHEAEIVRGGFNSGSGVNGQAFSFTVEDDALAERLRLAMEAQQEVKIHYHTELFTFCRSDSGDDFLDSFEVIGARP